MTPSPSSTIEMLAPPPPHPDDAAVLVELSTLAEHTFTLWDQDWVGFSWRAYTHDHVRRVRNLAMTLCALEGGSPRPLDVAATLHDITKPYDGEIVMKDGKRVLDENGFWRNAYLPPARHNRVTQIYERMNLRGQLHNVSGARVAEALLDAYGYDAAFQAHVAEIIISHLRVTEETSLEGRCLYDADTIDANIGLPALYRNIHITMHHLERQYDTATSSLDEYLRQHFSTFFVPYVSERLPNWIAGKQRDFIERLTTSNGQEIAQQRIDRLSTIVQRVQEELVTLGTATSTGISGILH
ncbi:MAG: HD domain-containing protein, partial [Chloroflexi bacterium]|nr:HD domain-containing protein [Chloroflexota bacterium]